MVNYIRNMTPKLRNSEKKVAKAIMDNPEAVIYLSVSELAEKAGVSDPTVIRCCRRLGFKGYQDLKISLAREMIPQMKTIHEEVEESDDADTIVQKVFASNMQALKATAGILDMSEMTKAIEYLVDADQIHFWGLGGSSPVALDAHHKFFKLGTPCIAYSDSHMQAMAAALLGPTDVVVAISHSGSTKDIVQNLSIAQKTGAKTIAITSHSKSPVAGIADVVLCVQAKETAFRLEPMSSRIAQLSVIDALAVGLAVRRSEMVAERLSNARKALIDKRY